MIILATTNVKKSLLIKDNVKYSNNKLFNTDKKLNKKYYSNKINTINEHSCNKRDFRYDEYDDRKEYNSYIYRYYDERVYRDQNSSNRLYNKQKSNTNYNIQNEIVSNNNNRVMCKMSSKSRISELRCNKREVLLDTCSILS